MLATPPHSQDKTVATDDNTEHSNPYYRDLDAFLTRFEAALTHYEVLDVSPSAAQGEIKVAYHKALSLLYPPYKIGAQMPDKTVARMERAFSRISWAFSVLANYHRRKEYDRTVLPRITNQLPTAPPLALPVNQPTAQPALQVGKESPALQTGDAASLNVQKDDDRAKPGDRAGLPGSDEDHKAINIKRLPERPKVYKEFSSGADSKNRRRCERLKLSLPARVTGYDRKGGKWQEMTSTIDVSRTGVTLQLRKPLRHGVILHLTVPLPVKLRTHNYAASSYSVYALVRRIDAMKNNKRIVGLEFVGERPPSGYLDKPWATFRTSKWNGVGRRRSARVERKEIVTVEYFTDAMKSITRVMGRTENISDGGARIAVRTAPPEFEMVRVTCPSQGFESLATICNRYIGPDGFERLCVQFTENQWPIRETIP